MTDVNVRARGGAGDRAAEGDEGNALETEVLDQSAAFGAIRMHGHIDALVMIEA